MTRSIRHLTSLLVLLTCTVLAAGPPVDAAQAAPRLQVFFASDFTDHEYQKKAYTKVASLWVMPSEMPPEGNKAVVIVVILRDGKGADVRLNYESGSKAWDDAAVAAVKSAIPFEPLPEGYRRDSVEAHFHFLFME
jgi:protein TonB